ncbi:50S ribosomal protein L3 [archaeon]|nr:50S ribosomal protein L3 [archaeon]|tara:strand:- start:662 stop:1624 length:963 start_codon:yes stop_codon:yes gene_type:complete
MPTKHHPHRGSMQFWPKARSRKNSARVKSWVDSKENSLLGFIGYKAGMTHLLLKEHNDKSPRSKMNVFTPVTVVECPPIKVYSIRLYREDEDGSKIVSEIFSKKVDKELKRKTAISKKDNKEVEDFDTVMITIYTQPKTMGIGKKKPDMIEVGIGGKDNKDKLEYAKSLLDKELKVSEVIKEGEWIDVHSVTKGKGFSGTIKKFGVKRLQHKSEKKIRGIGTLGAWTTKKVQYTVAQPGRYGYHLRTEYNKIAIKLGEKTEEINPKGGFLRYGFVKNDYLLVRGSVPGSKKRPITITKAIRVKEKAPKIEIMYTNQESQQ